MSKYFSYFPTIEYENVISRDITRRSKFIEDNLNNPYVFLPYTIREEEKPEDVAFLYYGSVADTWLVLLANNIYDPYSQWPMTLGNLNKYIISKYESISGKVGNDILRWSQSQSELNNILYYVKIENEGLDTETYLRASPESFETTFKVDENGNIELDENGNRIILEINAPSEWSPVRVYDYEFATNEKKRDILLVDRDYKSRIVQEFKKSIRSTR